VIGERPLAEPFRCIVCAGNGLRLIRQKCAGGWLRLDFCFTDVVNHFDDPAMMVFFNFLEIWPSNQSTLKNEDLLADHLQADQGKE